MDKPEKTVNDTGTPNSELKDDDEDYNFMNNLSPITSIPTGQTIDLSGVFNRLNQGLSSSSPCRIGEEEEEDTEETVQLDNDCTSFRERIIDDGEIDVQPESDQTQKYWENLNSEITQPLIYGLPNDSEAFRGLEPVSNIGSDEKMAPKSEQDGCKCLALKCIHRKCTCYKGGLGCSIHCKCEECQNTFGRKVSSQKSDSIKEVGASRDRGCQCTKLKCMDNHCKCYKLRVGCSIHCNCEGCQNTFGSKGEAQKSDSIREIGASKKRVRGCQCKKLNCRNKNCKCYTLGVGCSRDCICQGCLNTFGRIDDSERQRKRVSTKSSSALQELDTVMAPRVVGSSDSTVQVGATKTHNRGCNCKISNCLNNYCNCYQWMVGCSILCRCQRCQNSFGRNDG